MISFIIDMNFKPFFCVALCTTNICVFRIARILELTGGQRREFWVPSSSAIRRRLQTSVVGKFPEKSMKHFLSPTPPPLKQRLFLRVRLRWSQAKKYYYAAQRNDKRNDDIFISPFPCNFPWFNDTELPFEAFEDLCVLLPVMLMSTQIG